MDEYPLEVEVRSDWHNPGEKESPGEYYILLSTGGPATRITGDLDEHGSPSSARIECQDWFTPWTYVSTSTEEDEALVKFAQHFYFGEG